MTMAMVLSLSACSGSSGSGSSASGAASGAASGKASSAESATDTGISVSWSTYPATDAQIQNMHQYYADPISKATGIKVDYKVYSDRNSLLVEVAGGGGPDILDLDGPTDVVEFANSGKALDLAKYADQYKWKDLFMSWAFSACYYKGKLYSLPTCYEGTGIYYNMGVMKKNGWEIPKTADELEALCKKVKSANLVPISFGNSNYQGAVDWLYSTFLSCYGGSKNLAEVLTGKDKLQTNKGTSSAMQKLVDWYKAGYFDNNSQSITNDDMVARFANGDAAMMVDGTWAANQLDTDYKSCDWKFGLMPAASADSKAVFPIAIGGCDVINANSKNPDAAAKVLNYAYSSNQTNHYESVVKTGAQPYPVNWFETSKLTGMDSKLSDLYTILNDSMKNNNIGYCSWTFFPADCRTYMNENTDSCFLGKLSVQDYLTKAQTYIDKAIQNKSAPQLPSLG